MKTSTLVAFLTRLTKALALAGPLVIFGFMYVLAVQPQREEAEAARRRVAALREDLIRQRAIVRSPPMVTEAYAKREFEIRTSEEDQTSDIADAIVSLANSPSVGGVTNLSIETAAAVDGPIDPRIALFRQPVAYTALTVTFDASYDRIGRFFWNLRTLPSTFELRSVELTPAPATALMHTRLVLFVFHRLKPNQQAPVRASNAQVVDVKTAPKWRRDPFRAFFDPSTGSGSSRAESRDDKLRTVGAPAPEPTVYAILISGQRRIALIDGRIVRVSDRVGSSLVRAIDQDSVLLITAAGETMRLMLERPQIASAFRRPNARSLR